ncbi:hypothetical protein TorRG33x02_242020 [Trema orientale]|uniref:Uncharacterized protein n=1 Tax=Trema orientale TaxID=63057 RepID=A0A2P5DTY4_TREOI|nr:hypothetical protein TorRG33x02_242020 [Trema orientale]
MRHIEISMNQRRIPGLIGEVILICELVLNFEVYELKKVVINSELNHTSSLFNGKNPVNRDLVPGLAPESFGASVAMRHNPDERERESFGASMAVKHNPDEREGSY